VNHHGVDGIEHTKRYRVGRGEFDIPLGTPLLDQLWQGIANGDELGARVEP
jgi:hypothetical protein